MNFVVSCQMELALPSPLCCAATGSGGGGDRYPGRPAYPGAQRSLQELSAEPLNTGTVFTQCPGVLPVLRC